MTPSDYADDLWNRALQYVTVYTEYLFKGVFMELLHESIRQSSRHFWGHNPDGDLLELARHTKSMASLLLRSTTPEDNQDKLSR